MPDALRLELNAAISEAVSKRVYFREGLAKPEKGSESDLDDVTDLQIGAVVWTRTQRSAAYNALARLGRGGIEGVAAVCGKSKLEVLDFMRVMDEAGVEAALRDPRRPVLGMDAVTAAVEVPDALLEALTDGARRIELYVQRCQAKAERRKWGELWNLDFEIATELHYSYKRVMKAELPGTIGGGSKDSQAMDVDTEQSSTHIDEAGAQDEASSLSGESSDPGELIDRIPIAKLLKLHTWIRLCSGIFMNKRKPRHWMRPGPSIRHTAFGDFYNLTVSLTRRIAHTALFQAQIRHRGMGGMDAPLVSLKDVKCAIEMLGLKENSFDYWVGVPRRHKLKCSVSPSGSKEQEKETVYMSLLEVEEHLKKEPYKTKRAASESGDEGVDDSSPESDHSESAYESSHVSETDGAETDDGADPLYCSSGATSAWTSDDADLEAAATLTRQGRRPRVRGRLWRPRARRSGSSASSHSSSGESSSSLGSSSSRRRVGGRRAVPDRELEDFHEATFDAAHDPADRGFMRRQLDALRTELEAEWREEDYLETLDEEGSKHEAARLRKLVEQDDTRYATQIQRPNRPRWAKNSDDGGESVDDTSDVEWNPAAGVLRSSKGPQPGHRTRASAASRHSSPAVIKTEENEEGVTPSKKGLEGCAWTTLKHLEDSARKKPKLERKKIRIAPNPDLKKKRKKSETAHRKAVDAFEAVGMDTVTRYNWRDVTEYISPWETALLNSLQDGS
jgi:hypothetical protein